MLSIIKLRILRLKDDVSVLILMTVMAFGLTAIFGISFNQYRPTVLIVDEDKSSYSENLIDELKRNNAFNFVNSDIDNAQVGIEEGKAAAALLINKGFNDNIENGKNVDLGIMKIKDDAMILALQEMLTSITMKMSVGIHISNITSELVYTEKPEINKEEIKLNAYKNIMESWKYKNPIKVTATIANTGTNSGYDNLMHSIIGFTMFFSMYTMVFSIGTILYDKQYKTWERMLVSPVSKSSIVGGSIVVSYLTGAVQMGILILGGKYLFSVDWGNSIAGVLMICAAFIFAVTSLGLMMSSFIKTQAQLGSIAPIVLTSTSMLGGCMWPLEIVNNKALLFLAELTPQKWAVQGVENIASKGMGIEAAVIPTIVLLTMGIIYFTIGVKRIS
ncbi:ABC-2 type transport system permease protein [Sedimentibacter acidaminivorans]|uniref:ABC-2 type transport system permease protein n=1 Tax=Sedimentibacter acidaminivorans TaxID=913099 RepID=A0ABS4GER6_9FIRM|nr:ABC transporter permease [Sedimentibacter acidaminivorans]MBP1926186.1 ABC-2 type transport system permease protein [Sedimentibacter acidaminivorans]